jgi:phosphopantothenoylcysteine synthetase/decarboxylase
MRILVTGGNTYVPIDKVRGITNIFKGKTACDITFEALGRGHNVTLLGNPGFMKERVRYVPANGTELKFVPYKTYNELYNGMRDVIVSMWPDVVVHSAAVSDYEVASIYPTPEHDWVGRKCRRCGVELTPRTDFSHCIPEPLSKSGKISSSHKRLTMDLVPTEKIVDKIRDPWAFGGLLVKFKLQVDMSDEELLVIAEKSRLNSGADIMVANCLEWAKERAYILAGRAAINVDRRNLAAALMEAIERFKR